MPRRERRVDNADLDRWVVSYADFITLLFAFFVVMYAVSSVNLGKYKVLAESLEDAFEPSVGKFRKVTQGNTDVNSNLLNSKNKTGGPSEGGSDVDGDPKTEGERVDEAYKAAKDKLLDKFPGDLVEVRKNDDWMEIEIKSNALFSSSEATPSPEAVAMLSNLAKTLAKTKNHISVEGYTDNVPIHTSRFPSNWELSAARAAAVVRVLTEAGVDPTQISAVGFGEQYPIASNDTPAGRKKNRRVILIVARNGSVQRLLNPKENLGESLPTEAIEEPAEIPVVNVIRTEGGGLKFTRGTAEGEEDAAEIDGVERPAQE